MKKHLDIILHVLLSFLIIYMGTGFTMVECTHHSDLTLMSMLQQMENEDANCESPIKSCMKVTVSKLSPTSLSQASVFDFHVLQPLMFINNCQLLPSPKQFHIVKQKIAKVMPHGPPDRYLHFLRQLII